MAVAVTVTDAIVALPFAFFLAKVATRRWRQVLFGLTLLPLWASYLAKVYAWINILSNKGVLPGIEGGSTCPRATSPTPTSRCGSSSPTCGCRS